MSEKERIELENELLLSKSKAQMINKYIDELEEKERLQNIIKEARGYCNEVIEEHKKGDYNVSTTQLAIQEHKGNIQNILDILDKE